MTSHLTAIDVLDVCAVMLQRCGLSADQLAAHMARPELPSAAPDPQPAEVAAPVPQQPRAKKLKKAKALMEKPPGPTALTTFTAGSSKTAPKLDDGPADFSQAKRTIDDKVRPVAQWQTQDLPPDPRYPSFASMRPGTDPRTGKEWGAAG